MKTVFSGQSAGSKVGKQSTRSHDDGQVSLSNSVSKMSLLSPKDISNFVAMTNRRSVNNDMFLLSDYFVFITTCTVGPVEI